MSQLPSDFEKIVIIAQQFYESEYKTANAAIRYAVERCYALHCKPQRELTAKELSDIFASHVGLHWNDRSVYLDLLEAHLRKQQEPETVKFRAARNRNDHSEIYMAKADSDWSGSNWEWLPGEPQTIEVKLP